MNESMASGAETEHPYTSLPAGKLPCARCAAVVDTAMADYDETGELVCVRCAGVNDIEATETRAVVRMKASAYGNLFVGVLAWLFNPYLVFTIMSVATASYTTKSLTGDWYRKRMNNRVALPLVGGVLGGVLGVAPVVIAMFT